MSWWPFITFQKIEPIDSFPSDFTPDKFAPDEKKKINEALLRGKVMKEISESKDDIVIIDIKDFGRTIGDKIETELKDNNWFAEIKHREHQNDYSLDLIIHKDKKIDTKQNNAKN